MYQAQQNLNPTCLPLLLQFSKPMIQAKPNENSPEINYNFSSQIVVEDPFNITKMPRSTKTHDYGTTPDTKTDPN